MGRLSQGAAGLTFECVQIKKATPHSAAFACVSGVYWIASFLAAVVAFFGRVNSSTPSLYLAWALVSSTS